MSRAPSPLHMGYHQTASASSSTTNLSLPYPPGQPLHFQPNGQHAPSSSSSSYLAPYASGQPHHPAQMQTHHPSIPPRSALRVNTGDTGRLRSNSSAVPGARASPRLVDPNPGYGGGGGMNHQFSRSMSHASPLSPEVMQGEQGMAREGRDVFMAVRNLRGLRESAEDSPTSPVREFGGSGDHSFVRSMSVGTDATLGQFSDTQPQEVMAEEEEGDETYTLDKIRHALKKSNDGGNTLDLSRRGIQQIGPAAVEVFRKGVGQDRKGVYRLALSYNSLRDNGLDYSFCRLSRLRYLNLKGNNFTVFPLALTEMPGLDILDMSKNQLRAFPDQPGRLMHIRVLSITNNKLVTLPSYLTKFDDLQVFKVDNNPIEWPPREVLGALVDGDSTSRERDESGRAGRAKKKEADLRPWIENMKSWMRQRVEASETLLEQEGEVETTYAAASELDSAKTVYTGESSAPADRENLSHSPTTRVTSQQTIRASREEPTERPSPPAPGPEPVSTRPSIGNRSRSTTLSTDNLAKLASPAKPPPLQIPVSHSRQPSTSTPPTSAISYSSTHSRQSSTNLPPPPPIPAAAAGHSRGASYTATQRLSASLASKKSLPDLRQSHAKIISDWREGGQDVVEVRTLGLGIKSPISARFNPTPTPPRTAEMVKSPSSASFLTDKERMRTLSRKGSTDMLRRVKGSLGPELSMGEKRNSQEGPLVDDSRNSYFRRLSTLPVSSISKAIPPSLLRCVDAIRGILFALSQLHSALRQYLVFAVSDRVANLFSKVLDPASGRMAALINALDRFDSMSRRGTPPVSAIRGVMDATRASISTFAKVVGVLRLQMPALKGTDVRYTRTLLLMIYGSMAEVSYSWTAIAPLLADLKVLMVSDGQGLAVRAVWGGTKMAASASFGGRTPISPIPERGESHSPPSASRSERTEKALGTSPLHQSVSAVDPSLSPTPVSTALGSGASAGRGVPIGGNRNRRQAGSFSTQDVQRGMQMVGQGSPVALTEGGWGRHKSSGSANSLLPRTEESDAEDEEARMLSALEDEELDTMLPNPPFALRAGVSNSSTINLPQTPPEHTAALQPIAMLHTTSHHSHSRRGHHGPSSSSGSSHMLQTNGYGVPRKSSIDIRPPTPASASASAGQLDEDLLDTIESATDVAFTAWLRIAEDVGASSPPSLAPGHQKSPSQSSLSSGPYSANDSRRPSTISARHYADLLDLLSSSEQTTSTLRECLMGIRANPHSPSQYAALHTHAQNFVKTVVKVTELIMNISATHSFPSGVKSCCARLVQFTREFAILFSVSNIRPGTSASMRSLTAAPGGAGGGGASGGHGQLSARSTSPMPLSSRSRSTTRSGSNSGSGSGSAPLSGSHTPRSGSMGMGMSQMGMGMYGAAGESSTEDLLAPHSAITPGSGNWTSAGSAGPPSAGLRGLQLPSRQAALARRRAGPGGGVPVR